MIKVEYGFGIGLDAEGREIPEAKQQAGLSVIRELAIRLFGGCTLCRTVGDWQDPETGKIFSERGMTLSVMATGNGEPLSVKIKTLAENIKDNLKQKAVYVTRYSVHSTLY